MRSTRTTLLVGIAALALVAGNGLASAQEKSESSKGAPHATQQMNHSGTSGQSSPGAQTQQPGAMSKQGQRTEGAQNRAQKEEQNRSSAQSNEKKGATATENERSKRSNTAQEREHKGGQNAAERSRNGNTAAEQQNRTGGTAAQQQNRTGGGNTNAERGRTGMEGLQGNASGMNVRLTDQQRTEIRSTVINGHGAPRVAHVDFDVTVGTVVPRGRIHVVPVPETLVRIEPAWRGFLYFVYEDEVVIVDPNDMKIVAVVAA
jgi:hypothetical protein